MREIYTDDVEGISTLIRNAKNVYPADDLDEKKAAYALMAIIYGLI